MGRVGTYANLFGACLAKYGSTVVPAALAGTAAVTGSPEIIAAALFAAALEVAHGVLTNLGSSMIEADREAVRSSRNHHLQIVIAGAMRAALADLAPAHTDHAGLFKRWEQRLLQALQKPANALPFVIPGDFTGLLDAANPNLAQAFIEAEDLLRSLLVPDYILVSSAPLPPLPADLRQALASDLLPAFQTAFANLLVRPDAREALNSFVRLSLQELVAGNRTLLDIHRLHVSVPQAKPYAPERELEILRAENRSIPVVGRDQDLADLRAWLAEPGPFSVRILTGPAGAGKTRLAIEFMDGLTGWDAGFLHDYENLSQRHWPKDTVVVIDYAATHIRTVGPWLKFLAHTAHSHKLRVLLLEREAHGESGWFQQLKDFIEPPEPKRVSPIDDLAHRAAILEATLALLGVSAPTRDHERLADERWRDPLYLMMAALVAKQSGLPDALSLSRTDLAERLAEREAKRLSQFAEPALRPLLLRLAALVTACRSLTFAELVQVAKEEGEALGRQFPTGPAEAADRLIDALGHHGQPAPIEPDIIGEAFLLRACGGSHLQAGTAALLRAARRYPAEVCAALTRTAQDFATDQRQDPIHWVKVFVQHGDARDVLLLMQLEGAMPHATLVLRELAVEVDQLLVERFGQIGGQDAEVARLRSNLSVRLRDLGRREEALAQAEEAVRLYRQLAAARPDAFLPYLAKSLAVCGNIKAGEQPAQALICYEGSLRLLTPPFLQLPQAHAPLMQTIVGVYLRTLQTAGQEPDMELLTPIIEQLQRLEDAGAVTPG